MGQQKKAASRGKTKLNEAADRAVAINSAKIAESLLNSTLEGNTSAAKLLFELADNKIDLEDEVKVRKLISLAEDLAAEPAWTDEDAAA
jgi:hypothetical protein